HVVVRDLHGVRVADLDVVAEDLVEAHLQGADAGSPPLPVLELRDPLARAPRRIQDGVEVNVEPWPDDAVAALGGRVFDQRARAPSSSAAAARRSSIDAAARSGALSHERSCRAPTGVPVRSIRVTSAGSSRLRTVAASSGMVASGE